MPDRCLSRAGSVTQGPRSLRQSFTRLCIVRALLYAAADIRPYGLAAQLCGICCDGSPGRTRTSDKRINSPLLYQLSYRGTASQARQVFSNTIPVSQGAFAVNTDGIDFLSLARQKKSGAARLPKRHGWMVGCLHEEDESTLMIRWLISR